MYNIVTAKKRGINGCSIYADIASPVSTYNDTNLYLFRNMHYNRYYKCNQKIQR